MSPETSSGCAPVRDRYTLDAVLGSGSAAIVYAGRDLVLDRVVAVKVYRPDGSTRHRVEQHREIEALRRLRHPGLVALHDGGTEPGPDGRTYLVTDLVDGPSLATRLDEGPLPAPDVLRLGAGLAAALAHVHAGGFVHRDIKPANILLDHGREPRLADFGIARALDGTIATATGAVAGTAAYLAPEQVRGEPVDSAIDVYALGLVLLEALTGQREYPGTMIESATARLHRRPAIPGGLPGNLGPLLAAMTHPHPAARPTAETVATALAAPAAAATAPSPTTTAAYAVPSATSSGREVAPSASAGSAVPARSWMRRNAPTMAAAAILLAFLLGGVALLTPSAGPDVVAAPATTSLSPVPLDPPATAAPANLGLVPSRPSEAAAAPEAAHAGPEVKAAAITVDTRTGGDAVPAAGDDPPPAALGDGSADAGHHPGHGKANGNANGNGQAQEHHGKGADKGAGKGSG